MKAYVASSYKNEEVRNVIETLEVNGVDCHDWISDEAPEAWDTWFKKTADSPTWDSKRHVDFMWDEQMQRIARIDYAEMDKADIGILVLPAGRSAHLELGYMIGRGLPTAVYFPDTFPPQIIEPEPMLNGATYKTNNLKYLTEWVLRRHENRYATV